MRRHCGSLVRSRLLLSDVAEAQYRFQAERRRSSRAPRASLAEPFEPVPCLEKGIRGTLCIVMLDLLFFKAFALFAHLWTFSQVYTVYLYTFWTWLSYVNICYVSSALLHLSVTRLYNSCCNTTSTIRTHKHGSISCRSPWQQTWTMVFLLAFWSNYSCLQNFERTVFWQGSAILQIVWNLDTWSAAHTPTYKGNMYACCQCIKLTHQNER